MGDSLSQRQRLLLSRVRDRIASVSPTLDTVVPRQQTAIITGGSLSSLSRCMLHLHHRIELPEWFVLEFFIYNYKIDEMISDLALFLLEVSL